MIAEDGNAIKITLADFISINFEVHFNESANFVLAKYFLFVFSLFISLTISKDLE